MKIGPKYKKARQLGAPVFDKTQTQKFELAEQRKGRDQSRRFRRAPSEYALQLREKQKARYSYLVSERQFARYVRESMAATGAKPSEELYRRLESRLDSVAYRMGLAATRTAARQLASHGHLTVNGRRVTIPSYQLKVGDKVAVRESSRQTKLFEDLKERLQHYNPPAWLGFDENKLQGQVEGWPQLREADLLFNIDSILEFYSR